MKKRVYCVGNAHLDPMWMWRWQEGSCEAKATIRSALDRMNEYPEFRFVCSSASIYRWVEEFAPEMFEEVKARIKEGRWIIVNGWHVQPDCNNPSGEGFARQTLYAQRYFMEKFGTTASVGYNVDSFGHNAMMPMILRKSGMNRYIYMRPSPKEMPRETTLFHWDTPDGSSVLTYRLHDAYCHNYSEVEHIEKHLEDVEIIDNNEVDDCAFFYGVGNHGGGPTKHNLDLLRLLQQRHPDKQIIYSDLQDFFKQCEKEEAEGKKIPHFVGDLQHHASGCYATVSDIKDGIRKAENSLYTAEVFSMLSNKLLGRSMPKEKIADAWRNVCFTHFHDSMGGCSIEDACNDAILMLGEARSVASTLENNALQSLSWAIDTEKCEFGYPIILFNPHANEVTQKVIINKQAYHIYDANGKEVPKQEYFPQKASCQTKNQTMFYATVTALGYATYYVDENYDWGQLVPCQFPNANFDLENEFLRVKFNAENGLIKEIFDKKENKELLASEGGYATIIDESDHDTWSHAKNFFDKEIGKFEFVSMVVTENGPVRKTIKVVSKYHTSTLTQYISLGILDKQIQVKAYIDFHEVQRMVKIAFPLNLTNTKAYYEIPFGVIERPTDGEEEPGLMWTAMKGDEGMVCMLNDNRYSFSMKENVMNLTALRTPFYGDHGAGIHEETRPTDQGEHIFSYAIGPATSFAEITARAREFNMPLSHVLENKHKGFLPLNYQGIENVPENFTLSAIKESEDGSGLIVRIHEAQGIKTRVKIGGNMLPKVLETDLKPFEVKTMFLPKDGEWKEVLMSELEMK